MQVLRILRNEGPGPRHTSRIRGRPHRRERCRQDHADQVHNRREHHRFREHKDLRIGGQDRDRREGGGSLRRVPPVPADDRRPDREADVDPVRELGPDQILGAHVHVRHPRGEEAQGVLARYEDEDSGGRRSVPQSRARDNGRGDCGHGPGRQGRVPGPRDGLHAGREPHSPDVIAHNIRPGEDRGLHRVHTQGEDRDERSEGRDPRELWDRQGFRDGHPGHRPREHHQPEARGALYIRTGRGQEGRRRGVPRAGRGPRVPGRYNGHGDRGDAA